MWERQETPAHTAPPPQGAGPRGLQATVGLAQRPGRSGKRSHSWLTDFRTPRSDGSAVHPAWCCQSGSWLVVVTWVVSRAREALCSCTGHVQPRSGVMKNKRAVSSKAISVGQPCSGRPGPSHLPRAVSLWCSHPGKPWTLHTEGSLQEHSGVAEL